MMSDKYQDHFGAYAKSDYYTTYYKNEADEDRETKSSEPHVYERKGGYIKVYNGHMGTFAWEKEDDPETT